MKFFFSPDTNEAAMTSKGAKETIVSKLGFKSSSSASKAEAELEKVRKENAHLKKKIDELAKRHIKPPDSDKNKLLEVKEVFVLSVTSKNFRLKSYVCLLFDCCCLLMSIRFLVLYILEDPFP